jgi:hypothetical protein
MSIKSNIAEPIATHTQASITRLSAVLAALRILM